mmetsp:Transcript_15112/g.51210  ORF Transcript_15112/g.51210 Transcript_15112/m.51210 type:complete len:208 (-) Transcript_15112:1362-1985(-)
MMPAQGAAIATTACFPSLHSAELHREGCTPRRTRLVCSRAAAFPRHPRTPPPGSPARCGKPLGAEMPPSPLFLRPPCSARQPAPVPHLLRRLTPSLLPQRTAPPRHLTPASTPLPPAPVGGGGDGGGPREVPDHFVSLLLRRRAWQGSAAGSGAAGGGRQGGGQWEQPCCSCARVPRQPQHPPPPGQGFCAAQPRARRPRSVTAASG